MASAATSRWRNVRRSQCKSANQTLSQSESRTTNKNERYLWTAQVSQSVISDGASEGVSISALSSKHIDNAKTKPMNNDGFFPQKCRSVPIEQCRSITEQQCRTQPQQVSQYFAALRCVLKVKDSTPAGFYQYFNAQLCQLWLELFILRCTSIGPPPHF